MESFFGQGQQNRAFLGVIQEITGLVLSGHLQVASVSGPFERRTDHLLGQFRSVRLVRKMGQDHPGEAGVKELHGEGRRGFIREVPVARRDASLYAPRVGCASEQHPVVIRFENEEV